MSDGLSLETKISPIAASIGGAARSNRLTIYAGAGLSVSPPTGLPGASVLAASIAHRLDSTIDFTSVNTRDLLAVADLIVSKPTGRRLLTEAVSAAAPFTRATPGLGHKVLALLICEGAAMVLEANYDTCIEDSVQEKIPIVVTDQDRLDNSRSALLKVHGCATRPGTLLVTTEDLRSPPLYAKAEFAARIAVGSVLFVGLGSPADYVTSSLQAFMSAVNADTLTIVDPQMAQWPVGNWSSALPDISNNARVAENANDFLDEVLRFYVGTLLTKLEAFASRTSHPASFKLGIDTLTAKIRSMTASQALVWLRMIWVGIEVGKSSVDSARVFDTLLAIGGISSGTTLKWIGRSGMLRVSAGDENYVVLPMCSEDNLTASEVAAEANLRVYAAAAAGELFPGEHVVAISAGHFGALGPNALAGKFGLTPASIRKELSEISEQHGSDSLMGDYLPNHLIDSGLSNTVYLISSSRVHELVS